MMSFQCMTKTRFNVYVFHDSDVRFKVQNTMEQALIKITPQPVSIILLLRYKKVRPRATLSVARRHPPTTDGRRLPSLIPALAASWALGVLKGPGDSKDCPAATDSMATPEHQGPEDPRGCRGLSSLTMKRRWREFPWKDCWPTERTPNKSISEITSLGEPYG